MPGGVASHFVQILQGDQRSARAKVLVVTAVALALFVPAYLVYPWPGLVVHAAGLLVGLGAGWLYARRTVTNYEASIRGTWTQWMRFAVACESVPEIYRKVRGRSSRNLPFVYAAILTALWSLEILLLVVAFQGTNDAVWDIPVLLANGAAAGALVGFFLHVNVWYGQFRDSVSELVESGEIGVWGVL